MIIIPQRLFSDKRVKILMQDGNTCILSKEIDTPVVNREGYISNHVISILLSGEQHLRTYEEQLIKVKPNEVVFIPRGMYYVSDLIPKEGNFRCLLFYFDDQIIEEFLSNTKVTAFSNQSVPDHLKFGVVPTINQFATSLLTIYQDNNIRNKQFLDLKILELLYLLNNQASNQKFADFLFRLTLPKKRNIKPFMEQNFHKPLKVEDYAYLTGRSMSTFRRDFKAHFNTTPQQWIKDKRIVKAVNLLTEKELSVTELAYEVGYENISYFIKEFKKRVGQSPKQYILALHRNNLN